MTSLSGSSNSESDNIQVHQLQRRTRKLLGKELPSENESGSNEQQSLNVTSEENPPASKTRQSRKTTTKTTISGNAKTNPRTKTKAKATAHSTTNLPPAKCGRKSQKTKNTNGMETKTPTKNKTLQEKANAKPKTKATPTPTKQITENTQQDSFEFSNIRNAGAHLTLSLIHI